MRTRDHRTHPVFVAIVGVTQLEIRKEIVTDN